MRSGVKWLVLGIALTVAQLAVMPKLSHAQVQQTVEVSQLVGAYTVEGRNTDGSAYSGSLDLTVIGGVANLVWSVGNRTYKGQGSFIGNVLVVNWGSSAPVLYTVDLQGNLAGTWDRGRASERLIRK